MFNPNEDCKSMGHTKSTGHTKPTKDSKSTNTPSSNKWGSSMPMKTDLSIVDKILMEESSCAKHSKTGSVNKAKKTAIKPCYGCLFTWINDTLFYFQAEKSSRSHTMSSLFEN